jgi:hypothetical protein
MDYSSKSYNDRLREQYRFNRNGCIQFLLFFLMMAIGMILCAIFSGDAFE